MAETKSVAKAMVREVVWADAKKVLGYFMQDQAVKNAFVKLLIDSGLTVAQIREHVKISPSQISEIRNMDSTLLSDSLVEALRSREINRLYLIGEKVLRSLDNEDKLEKSTPAQLAYVYKLLLDSRRLLENKSTANIAVQVQALNNRFDTEANKINTLLQGIGTKNPAAVIETTAQEVEHAATA